MLLYATDTQTGRLTPVVKSLLERGSFVVDMQAMDWQTVLSRRTRKEAPDNGGWQGFITTWVSADILDPVMTSYLAANCEKANVGWPCDATMEKLRGEYAKAETDAKRKELATAVQVRASEFPTHVQLGQYNTPSAIRNTLSGHLRAPVPMFWNVKKQKWAGFLSNNCRTEEALTTVIHNTAIVTVDDDDTVHYNAAIAIDGDRIAEIGPSAELLARNPAADRIDGTGKLVMPGFANIHTHFTMTLARGVFEDLSPPHKPPFSGGLSPIPLPDMTPDERRAMALLGALEALRSGTTHVLEDSNDVDHYAGALADTGMRFLLAERAYDRVCTSIGDPAPYQLDRALGQSHIRIIERNHREWNGKADGRMRIAISAWAPDMCSPELLQDLSALQKQLDTRITIHLNQIWGEVAAVRAHRNRLPTEYLADLGFLNDRVICAHCRCMEPAEEKILGEARVNVSFNSAIAARRGLSPRVTDLEKYGCNIGMGSDNMAEDMAEDMVEVMRTGLFMERVRRADGRQPTPEQALRWASRNGYRALGVPDGGWLAPGNKADLIMVDLQRAHLIPVLRVVSDFVHNGQARDVQSVMVDGKWLMKDGVVLTMDEAAILREAQRVANAAWSRTFRTRFTPPAGFSPDALP